MLALIKELGLINKKVTEVPSLWGLSPDILEVPAAMFTEAKTGVPILVDTIGAVGGLYGILGALLNPCIAGGMLKTELRLQKMTNPKTGKNYTEAEAAKEAADMCRLMGKLRGRIAALKRAGNK